MSQEIQNNQNRGQNFDQEFLQMTKKSVELLQKIDETGKNKKEQLQQAQQIFKEYVKLGHNSNILKSQIKKNSNNHNKSNAVSENSPRKNNSSEQLQELVRSQHTYKLSNELKYSMSKNIQ
ncbi:hypothetical protein PPERSA_01492 [Pseudocohnilembus persalinus]|uniref:Uncharacterized protein n=1 Tax=Pseudocohnilembus persalinus TaxID=266149 RepID=A0A0V0QHQ2_PSEPJ|nr:hypothetical protein PPERSA_01492 [Pseudocohnilembus persalinus]|eukprot:KRX01589.1 hypothetical protein PPERSA_01492 [Pseudocohnilembus persalinus]